MQGLARWEEALQDYTAALELAARGGWVRTCGAHVHGLHLLCCTLRWKWHVPLGSPTPDAQPFEPPNPIARSESPDPFVINSRGNCYNSLGRWAGALPVGPCAHFCHTLHVTHTLRACGCAPCRGPRGLPHSSAAVPAGPWLPWQERVHHGAAGWVHLCRCVQPLPVAATMSLYRRERGRAAFPALPASALQHTPLLTGASARLMPPQPATQR